MTVDLKANEIVIKVGNTTQVVNKNTINGKLIVTNQRIYFKTIDQSHEEYNKEILPESIRNFSKYLPLTHVVTMLRGLWIGESWSQHTTEIWVLLGMTLVGIVISSFTFRWE